MRQRKGRSSSGKIRERGSSVRFPERKEGDLSEGGSTERRTMLFYTSSFRKKRGKGEKGEAPYLGSSDLN